MSSKMIIILAMFATISVASVCNQSLMISMIHLSFKSRKRRTVREIRRTRKLFAYAPLLSTSLKIQSGTTARTSTASQVLRYCSAMDEGDISNTPSWMTPTKKESGIFIVQKISVHQSTILSTSVCSSSVNSKTNAIGTITTSKAMASAAIISQKIRLGDVGIAMKCRSAPVYFTSGIRSISCNFLSKFAIVKRPLDFTLNFLWWWPGRHASFVAKLCVATPSSSPPMLTKERARRFEAPRLIAGGRPF
mmetsp:Transcript_22849/g.52314  ORF Transcript_22849/g.52314 Transcript_22849/m.52314 type:complete len:249 (+) Transcript_22849:1262-2008(+)